MFNQQRNIQKFSQTIQEGKQGIGRNAIPKEQTIHDHH